MLFPKGPNYCMGTETSTQILETPNKTVGTKRANPVTSRFICVSREEMLGRTVLPQNSVREEFFSNATWITSSIVRSYWETPHHWRYSSCGAVEEVLSSDCCVLRKMLHFRVPRFQTTWERSILHLFLFLLILVPACIHVEGCHALNTYNVPSLKRNIKAFPFFYFNRTKGKISVSLFIETINDERWSSWSWWIGLFV